MQVSRISTGDWNHVKAFFDVTTSDGLTIKGFKIVKGSNGLFVGCPSQKDSSGTYKDTVWMDKETKDELQKIALHAYENGINGGHSEYNSKPVQDDIPF